MVEIKKEVLILVIIFFILIPMVYAFNLLDVLNQGMEAITGKTAVTVSIAVGDDPPNITDIMLDGQSLSPTDGGITYYEVSFLANDTSGLSNLENGSAYVNVSLSDTSYSDENFSCTHEYDETALLIRYNCTIGMEYYWTSGTYGTETNWSVMAQINDSNNNHFSNKTATFTYGVSTYFNLTTPTQLDWDPIAPGDTNQTSTTNMTLENTGNRATLNVTTKINDLFGTTSTTKYIPALNFSVGNMSGAANPQCEYTNQSGPITYGLQPIVGVNETSQYVLYDNLERGQGSSESLYYCLFDVPGANEIQSETYDTSLAGQWVIDAGA